MIEVNGQDSMAQKVHLDPVAQPYWIRVQQFNLFPHLSVLENLMLAPLPLKRAKTRRGLSGRYGGKGKRLSHRPRRIGLSGGQQQRAAIAGLQR